MEAYMFKTTWQASSNKEQFLFKEYQKKKAIQSWRITLGVGRFSSRSPSRYFDRLLRAPLAMSKTGGSWRSIYRPQDSKVLLSFHRSKRANMS